MKRFLLWGLVGFLLISVLAPTFAQTETQTGQLKIKMAGAPVAELSLPHIYILNDTKGKKVASFDMEWDKEITLNDLPAGDTYLILVNTLKAGAANYVPTIVTPDSTSKEEATFIIKANEITPVNIAYTPDPLTLIPMGKVTYSFSEQQNLPKEVEVGFINQNNYDIITKKIATDGSTPLNLPVGKYAIFSDEINKNNQKYRFSFKPFLIEIIQNQPSNFSAKLNPYQPLEKSFAPILDLSWTQKIPLSNYPSLGIKTITLNYLSSNGSCAFEFKNGTPIMDIPTHVKAIQGAGGDIILSFIGIESSKDCKNADFNVYVNNLQHAIKSVIQKYHVYNLDFYDRLTKMDATGQKALAKAIANLQAEDSDIRVSFTLPVAISGLTPNGITLLSNIISEGVKIDRVNMMAMNFGPSFTDEMSKHIATATEATFTQMQSLFPNTNSAKLWSMIGIIPMIGQNETGQIVSLQNAKEITSYAKSKGIGALSIWTLSRDKECSGFEPQCSQVKQKPFEFSGIFNDFVTD